jgi:hypothetical protein
MKKTVALSVLLLAAFCLTGCLKENCGCDPDPADLPPVVFQYEYVNYAWGYRHHGFLIDEKGYVNGFRQPGKWNFIDSTGMMSNSEMEFNLAQCDSVFGKVDTDELEEYYLKIKDIRYSKIDNYGWDMADAGVGTFSAWLLDETSGRYEQVFLVSNGDVNRVNTHPDVDGMVDWLRKIGETTDRFYWYDGR